VIKLTKSKKVEIIRIMSNSHVVLRFSDVTFGYSEKKLLLEEANFSLRQGSKVTIMGQNGAGKSSLLKLIMKENVPFEGKVSADENAKIAIAKQVFSREEKEETLRDYFAKAFDEIPYNLDKQIAQTLSEVGLEKYDLHRAIKTYSGGQQARILLAYALIQNPDILLLDEPTNNLDEEGIGMLTMFLIMYDKTCLVISHDAEFLNSFTDGVLYLNVHNRKVEQYSGDYYTVSEEIEKQVEREQLQNARMERQIQDQKDKINFFANKGGKMRKLASKLRDQVSDAEENKVEVRKEDKTIRAFKIPVQTELSGAVLTLPTVTVVEHGEVVHKPINLEFRKKTKIQLSGPNGIGKTTLLNSIAEKTLPQMEAQEDLKIGYYSQDFHNLDYGVVLYESLLKVRGHKITDMLSKEEENYIRGVAASFLLGGKEIATEIGHLSEGQKGLAAFAHLVLQEPGLLILDEPTNHINFRHIPVIAKALQDYQGAMVVVSHVPDFVSQLGIEQEINLADL